MDDELQDELSYEQQYGYSQMLPVAIISALQKYKQSPNSLSARNAAFQSFYSVNPKAAGRLAGSSGGDGYTGLLNGINAVYGVTPSQQAQIEKAYAQAQMRKDLSNDEFAPMQETAPQQDAAATVARKKEGVGLLPGLLSPVSQSTLAVLRR